MAKQGKKKIQKNGRLCLHASYIWALVLPIAAGVLLGLTAASLWVKINDCNPNLHFLMSSFTWFAFVLAVCYIWGIRVTSVILLVTACWCIIMLALLYFLILKIAGPLQVAGLIIAGLGLVLQMLKRRGEPQ